MRNVRCSKLTATSGCFGIPQVVASTGLKKLMEIMTALFLFILCVGPALVGQNPPNVEDPAWIASKISEEAGTTRPLPSLGYLEESYRDVSISECTLRYANVLYDSFTKRKITDKVSVPLTKNTTVSIFHDSVSDYIVQLTTGLKSIAIERTKEADGRLEGKEALKTDQANIIFGKPDTEKNKEIASRIQKGLTQAILSCSVKETRGPS